MTQFVTTCIRQLSQDNQLHDQEHEVEDCEQAEALTATEQATHEAVGLNEQREQHQHRERQQALEYEEWSDSESEVKRRQLSREQQEERERREALVECPESEAERCLVGLDAQRLRIWQQDQELQEAADDWRMDRLARERVREQINRDRYIFVLYTCKLTQIVINQRAKNVLFLVDFRRIARLILSRFNAVISLFCIWFPLRFKRRMGVSVCVRESRARSCCRRETASSQ